MSCCVFFPIKAADRLTDGSLDQVQPWWRSSGPTPPPRPPPPVWGGIRQVKGCLATAAALILANQQKHEVTELRILPSTLCSRWDLSPCFCSGASAGPPPPPPPPGLSLLRPQGAVKLPGKGVRGQEPRQTTAPFSFKSRFQIQIVL